MAKIFKNHLEALKSVGRGVALLSKAVCETLGPKGRNVVIKASSGMPLSTKDGATVAKEIFLKDPFENMGAQLVKEAAVKTAEVAGDGTTTATLLASVIFSEGMKGVVSGMDPNNIRKGIVKAVDRLENALSEMAMPVDSKEEILQVATISANNDGSIGAIVAEAMEKVGRDGIVTVDEAKGIDTVLDVVEGMRFDQGFLSPYFVTNPETMDVDMTNGYVLLVDQKLSSAGKGLVSFLEQVIQSATVPLLIIADDIEGEALTTLVVNKLKAGLAVCAVKAPGFGDRKKALFEDIACITGAVVISEEIGLSLDSVGMEILGRAKRIKITKDSTTIVDGMGDPKKIFERQETLRNQIASSTSDYDKEKLEERLAKLVGGVAVIRLGAATEIELKEKKYRVEDALSATRSAVVEGIVPGGGVALVRSSYILDTFDDEELLEDEIFGINVVRIAACAPLKMIAKNCGRSGDAIIEKIMRSEDKNYGYNGLTDSFEDLIIAGVLDPVLVTKSALKHAASVAGLLLTSAVLIARKPEAKQQSMGGGLPSGMPGMPGMPGMGMM
ncbi:MAG: chaperonin GroEL [Victivallaceae bacterium]